MKYSVFFVALCIYMASLMLISDGDWRFILAWPMLTCLLMGSAYLVNKPWLVMGQSNMNNYNIVVAAINLPWLMITWLIFIIQMKMLKEDSFNKIPNTNITMSRYPIGVNLDGFDAIIELTAEFPSISSDHSRIIRIPNLDGIALSDYSLPHVIKSNNVLIHCAQGHGRTATFVSMVLVKLGYAKDIDTALDMVTSSRPLAKVSKRQYLQLKRFSS